MFSVYETIIADHMGSGGRVVERRTVNRGDGGSIPPTAVSKFRQIGSPHICLCLSEETLKAYVLCNVYIFLLSVYMWAS